MSTLAMTGSAVMDRAVAMKREKTGWFAPASIPRISGINQAARNPMLNGKKTPASPTVKAALPCLHTDERSISIPATSRNRAMARVVKP